MFKTSGGKYVAPQVIENVIKQSIYIEQVMVIGEGQKHPAALIQPNFEAVNAWLRDNGKNELNPDDMSSNSEVISIIMADVEKANAHFAQWEKVKKIHLTSDVWSVDAGHLTPTMKLRRKIVSSMYNSQIEKIYG